MQLLFFRYNLHTIIIYIPLDHALSDLLPITEDLFYLVQISNRIIQCAVFSVCLLQLSVMFLRLCFLCFSVFISSLSLFPAEGCSPVWVNCDFFIC